MKKYAINSAMVVGALILLGLLALHVRVGAPVTSVVVLKTPGMTCRSCSGTITDALQSVNGVAVIEADVDERLVTVGYDARAVSPETLVETVVTAGFDSDIEQVVAPERYKQITGRDIEKTAVSTAGCCGTSGCGSGTRN
jgi:copper chaperone CopZ